MNTLILFYDTMWGIALGMMPCFTSGCEIVFDRSRYAHANAVVFHMPEWKWRRRLGMPEKLPGQLWVAWTMESDMNYSYQRDPKFMRPFDLFMTYHLDSDVPHTYFTHDGNTERLKQILRQPPRPKLSNPPAVALVSSRINSSGRLDYLRELSRYVMIDSYGKFMRNKRAPSKGEWHQVKLDLIEQYKFTIAFENAVDQDYVTEKFFDPLIRGSVPVYLGAPNVEQFAPGERCFINAADFQNPRALADYLLRVASDDHAYEEYFAWKQKPFRAEFLNILDAQPRSLIRRLCEVVQARLARLT